MVACDVVIVGRSGKASLIAPKTARSPTVADGGDSSKPSEIKKMLSTVSDTRARKSRQREIPLTYGRHIHPAASPQLLDGGADALYQAHRLVHEARLERVEFAGVV